MIQFDYSNIFSDGFFNHHRDVIKLEQVPGRYLRVARLTFRGFIPVAVGVLRWDTVGGVTDGVFIRRFY